MLVRQMHRLGINSNVLQILGFASIFASIGAWRTAKESGDAPRAERFGIFIGLWAPTFFALASDVAVHESVDAELSVG